MVGMTVVAGRNVPVGGLHARRGHGNASVMTTNNMAVFGGTYSRIPFKCGDKMRCFYNVLKEHGMNMDKMMMRIDHEKYLGRITRGGIRNVCHELQLSAFVFQLNKQGRVVAVVQE